MKAYLAVTVDSELYRRIEQLRGREKRSTFVEHLLRLGMKEHRRVVDEENVKDVRKA
jgi:metal-responsive CopG/Arc/MetJ family transcriptional regulator